MESIDKVYGKHPRSFDFDKHLNMIPVLAAALQLLINHAAKVLVLFRPTFLSVGNSCIFVLYDLLKILKLT